jgi:GNAT superfamily N-acetyltransferase
MPSAITLQIAPNAGYSSAELLREAAIIRILGFSDGVLNQWWAMSRADAVMNTPEDIPPLRLYKQIRTQARQELAPDIVVVTALVDGQPAGIALWSPPKRLWRSETLAELIYRKALERKDVIEDWLYPSTWIKGERYQRLKKEQADCADKYLGDGKIHEMWYLHVLVVHPQFQRKGVGATLLDWGLNHARSRREKVYLESTVFGEGLYRRKGFKEVGFLFLGENDEIQMPCMLWDPATAPSQSEIASQKGEIEKEA